MFHTSKQGVVVDERLRRRRKGLLRAFALRRSRAVVVSQVVAAVHPLEVFVHGG